MINHKKNKIEYLCLFIHHTITIDFLLKCITTTIQIVLNTPEFHYCSDQALAQAENLKPPNIGLSVETWGCLYSLCSTMGRKEPITPPDLI